MENNNWKWYEENSSANNAGAAQQPNGPSQQSAPYYAAGGYQQAPQYGNRGGNGGNKRFGWAQLIVCMLVMALIAGAAGAGITKLINDNSAAKQQEALTNVPDEKADDSPNVVIDESALPDNTASPDNSSAGSSHEGASEGMTIGSTWTAEDSVNDMLKSSMSSVVGIDILTNVSSGSYYWYGSSSGNEGSQQASGSGSGVIITEDGYIVTCNHVIAGADTIIVYLQDGTEYQATVVGADEMTDLAVIKVDATGLPAAPIGTSANTTVGDTVYAIGNPLGALVSSVSDGIISGLDRLVTVEDIEMTLMQTNAAVNPGNSGGALYNSSGELIGVVNAKATGDNVEGIGFAIPIDAALPVITDLMDHGYVTGRPYLGITPQDVYLSSGSRGYFGYSNYTIRVQIQAVESGSCADKAGLVAGDVILTLDGNDVYGSAELSSLLYAYNIGDTLKITVLRNNEQKELTVTLGERAS